MWRELWSTPMSAEWERLAYPHVVARYVVVVLRSLEDAEFLSEARQLEDKLGLTPWSMLRNRWLVEPPDPDAKRATPRVRQAGSVVQLRPTRTADDE